MTSSRSGRKTGSTEIVISKTRTRKTFPIGATVERLSGQVVSSVPQSPVSLALVQFPVAIAFTVVSGLYIAIGIAFAVGLFVVSDRGSSFGVRDIPGAVCSIALIASAWPLVALYLTAMVILGIITAGKESDRD